MQLTTTLSLVLLSVVASSAISRVKRDSWRTWEAVNANCDNSALNNPCVTCQCWRAGSFSGEPYNSCREDTKQCWGILPCVDATVKPGECCPSCPNGPNCRVYGKIVQPGAEQIFAPGTTNDYSICQPDGSVKRCTVTDTIQGNYNYQRTQCFTSR